MYLPIFLSLSFPDIFCFPPVYLYNYLNGVLGGQLVGLTAIAALKKKRKKFSSSKNICPVTESISAANAVDLLNDKVLYICT